MFNENYIQKLAMQLDHSNIDGVIIGPSKDLEYITGFLSHEDERFQGFFLTREGKYFCISPKINSEEIENIMPIGTKIYPWDDGDGFVDTVLTALSDYNLSDKLIAVNSGIKGCDLLDLMDPFQGKIINGVSFIENSRAVKTIEEINNLKKAGKLADEVMEELVHFIKPGMMERDVKDKIKESFSQKDCEGISFEPIVAVGSNSSKPHYNQDDGVIQEKDVVLLDFGCRCGGVCSDISRTFFVGEPTEEEKEVYELILKANRAGVNAVKEGVTAEYIDQQARTVITDAGYGPYFLNRLGHGIGFSVHEAPYIKRGNKQIIKKGMAFSVEPGISLPNKFGMRIEDIVVADDSGPMLMNNFERGMIIIK